MNNEKNQNPKILTYQDAPKAPSIICRAGNRYIYAPLSFENILKTEDGLNNLLAEWRNSNKIFLLPRTDDEASFFQKWLFDLSNMKAESSSDKFSVKTIHISFYYSPITHSEWVIPATGYSNALFKFLTCGTTGVTTSLWKEDVEPVIEAFGWQVCVIDERRRE
jgi:hypothetical protein